VLAAVLAVASAAGLAWRRRTGRLRVAPAATSEALPADLLAELGVEPGPVTLLQFSSAFCRPCVATRHLLADVAGTLPGVRHVEVDAESHLDAVRRLKVLRTPTLLVLDGGGRVVNRASGLPRRADVAAAVGPLLGMSGPDHGIGRVGR
jgi:thiol-disulfide isomerase/thioredoxin